MTRHGNKRIKERVTDYSNKDSLLTLVRKNGRTKEDFIGEFYQYLLNKSRRGAKVRVYKNNIYILAKNSKKLITVYSVPSQFLPVTQYGINSQKKNVMNHIAMLDKKPVELTLKNAMLIKGILLKKIQNEQGLIIKIIIQCYENDLISINIDDIEKLILDKQLLTEQIAKEMGVTL